MINELDCPTIGLSDAELKQLIFRELEKYSLRKKDFSYCSR